MMKPQHFDWGEALPESWWRSKGEMLGADERELKFAAALTRGATKYQAAYEAGYSPGNPAKSQSMRCAGSRAAKNNCVRKLIALAQAELSGTAGNGEMTPEELRQRLTGLARHPDPKVALPAIQYLEKIERDRQRETSDPQATLNEIAKVDYPIARYLCERYGFPLPDVPEPTGPVMRLRLVTDPVCYNGRGSTDTEMDGDPTADAYGAAV